MQKRRIILYMVLIFIPFIVLSAQKVAPKTNLLYWATGTPNIGMEFSFANRWSVEASGGYNGWKLPEQMSLRHWLARIEPRFWVWKPFMGHFVGVHATFSHYNIGNISFIKELKEHTYNGDLYGGGLTYGYHFVLKGRWGLELSLSAGYFRLEYDKYFCAECNELIESYTRDYFGPTKASISLIYMLR